MTRARQQKATANNGQRIESTRGGGDARYTNPTLKAPQTALKRRIRHNPVSQDTAPLLAACRVRFDESNYSISDIARATVLDKADVSRALNLREEPTPRTLGRLCEYFNIASAADLNCAERKRALLIGINATLGRLQELTGAFMNEIEDEV